MTAILGISAFYHDSAAALVVDGEIVAAAQEERFTRKKHDARFPKQAVDYCLQEAGFAVKQTRQLFWQPVSLQVLFQWVSRRTGLLGQLPENIYNAGRDRLMAQLDRSGGEHLLPSELVFLEAWAGKPAESLPDGR